MPQATFFGVEPGNPGRGEVAWIGVPFDGLSTAGTGSAAGPAALRRYSREVGKYSVRKGRVCQARYERSRDGGDVVVDRFAPTANFDRVAAAVSDVLDAGATPLLVGGDHSLTYPAFSEVARRHEALADGEELAGKGRVRLVQVDAHYDATDPAEWGCGYNHGTWVRNLIDDGLLHGEQLCQIGVRDFQFSASGAEFLSGRGCFQLPMHEITRRGLNPLLEHLQRDPERPTYVTFDIDSLDPAFAPGTGEHMVGGLSACQALDLVHAIDAAGLNLVGADLVEVAPIRDHSGRTRMAAAQLLAMLTDALHGAIDRHG